MNRLQRAVTTLAVAAGISLGAVTAPATTATTSEGHPASPDVFHCC